MRSFVNLRPLKAEFIGFRYIDSCSVVQPSKERCPHGIWLTTAARRSIFVVKKRVSSQHRHLFATGRVIKAPKKITLLPEPKGLPLGCAWALPSSQGRSPKKMCHCGQLKRNIYSVQECLTFVFDKIGAIKVKVLFIFQGFTNVPLYKLMQHRPKVASPDLKDVNDQ